MDRVPVSSRALRSIGYDAATECLQVEFKNGGLYEYLGVPPQVYDWLQRTPNKGAYVSHMITPKYPCRTLAGEASVAATAAEDLLAALQESLTTREKRDP
jgi:hypothetical protein